MKKDMKLCFRFIVHILNVETTKRILFLNSSHSICGRDIRLLYILVHWAVIFIYYFDSDGYYSVYRSNINFGLINKHNYGKNANYRSPT